MVKVFRHSYDIKKYRNIIVRINKERLQKNKSVCRINIGEVLQMKICEPHKLKGSGKLSYH